MTLANPQPTRTGIGAWWRDLSRGAKAIIIIVAIVAIAYVTGYRGSGGTAPGTSTAQRGAACERVNGATLDAIASGVKLFGGTGSLRNGYAVKAPDRTGFYVAADIEGSSGLDGADDIGVWIVNDLNNPGLIDAVDAVADEFSDWGDARNGDRPYNITSPGVRDAKECAEDAA